MKVKFNILYKTGHQDEIIQEVTEENEASIERLVETIQTGFKENMNGAITFGDGLTGGYFIRLADVSRIKVGIISE